MSLLGMHGTHASPGLPGRSEMKQIKAAQRAEEKQQLLSQLAESEAEAAGLEVEEGDIEDDVSDDGYADDFE